MGTTYTRQSSGDIVDGSTIEASHFNDEFDQLLAAFAVSTGHTHDGTAAEGGPVTKLLGTAITIGDGTAGTDITMTFDGESNNGVLTWMEDEDLFKFSDAINVGVDDTGHDVKFFAATAGSYLLWDESADSLLLTDSTPLKIGDSQDLTLYHDGSNSYITNAVGALKIATETSGIAVTIGHTTSEVTVADNLTVTGTLTLGSGAELTEAELEFLDGITAGTVTASKAVVVDSSKDIGTFRNVTIDGTFSDGNYTFDTSGNVSGLGTVGSGAITSSGVITGTTIEATGDTSSGDNAAIGYTSAEGLILTGQGSTSDVTLKNDADGTVFTVPTGTDDILFPDSAKGMWGAGSDMQLYHDGTNSYITNSQGALKLATETSGIAITIGHTTSETTVADNLTVTGTLTGTLATAAQGSVTSLGTLTTLTVDNVIVNGTTIGHTDDTDLLTLADAALTAKGTITVGVDDTGHDVKFFGASAGAYSLWDESANLLDLRGATAAGPGYLKLTTGELTVVDADKLGRIDFQAPLESSGTDAILVGASIWAEADDTFAAGVNNTDLVFALGKSEAAAEKFRFTADNEIGIAGANYGTDGQVLTSGGAGAAVAWEDAGGGAITELNNATANELVTVGSTTTELDAEANLTFTGSALTCIGTVTVGINDTGHDVKFFGATSGAYMLWDESTDDLVLAGAANLYLYDAGGGEKLSSDGTDLTINSGNDINLTATTDINVPSDVGITFGNDGEKIEGDGTDLTISGNNINLTATADVVIPADVGITFGSGEKIEGDSTDLTITSGAKINLTATSDVHIPNDVGIVFGGASEKIEGDGTDLTISANNLTVDAAADIILDAGGNNLTFKSGGTAILDISNSSSDAIITSSVQDKDIIIKGDDGGGAITALTIDMSAAGQFHFKDGTAALPILSNAGDTNTGLFFSAADTMAFSAGGTSQFTMADGLIAPVTDNDVDLGTSSLEFKDGYFDGTLYCDTLNLAGTSHTSISGGVDFEGFSARLSSAQSIAEGNVYTVVFNTEDFDVGSNYNTGTGIAEIAASGSDEYWLFTASVDIGYTGTEMGDMYLIYIMQAANTRGAAYVDLTSHYYMQYVSLSCSCVCKVPDGNTDEFKVMIMHSNAGSTAAKDARASVAAAFTGALINKV